MWGWEPKVTMTDAPCITKKNLLRYVAGVKASVPCQFQDFDVFRTTSFHVSDQSSKEFASQQGAWSRDNALDTESDGDLLDDSQTISQQAATDKGGRTLM